MTKTSTKMLKLFIFFFSSPLHFKVIFLHLCGLKTKELCEKISALNSYLMERLVYISDLMIVHKTLCMKEILEISVLSCFGKNLHFHSERVACRLYKYRSTQQAKQTNVI